jgi:hypothetical protein
MYEGRWRHWARSIEARLEIVDECARATDREFRWGMVFVFVVIAISWFGFASCLDCLHQRVKALEAQEAAK